MKINISTELDILFEIPILISSCVDIEKTKSQYIKELHELGINGDIYYSKNLKVLDKYMKTFKKYMKLDKEEMFFIQTDDPNDNVLFANIFFICIFLSNRKIYEDLDSFNNEELRSDFLKIYNEFYETNFSFNNLKSLDDILLFLKSTDFSEKTKWKFTLILENPKKYYSMYIDLINKNISAFNKTLSTLEKPLKPLLEKYLKYVEYDKHKLIKPLFENYNSISILPSVITTGLISIPNNIAYVGVFLEDLYDSQFDSLGGKGNLIYKLKSLADKSKMDIILLLKSEPKYSLEIAEALKLTPATVSYHMSNLLECSMVSLMKKEGKSYYYIDEENIKLFIKDLENTLLH